LDPKTYQPGEIIKCTRWSNNKSKYYLSFGPGSNVDYLNNYDSTSGNWVGFTDQDGADGPGFRLVRGPLALTDADGVEHYKSQGQVWGPYLNPDRFKLRGCAILDLNERPILYYVARSKNPRIDVAATWDPSYNSGFGTGGGFTSIGGYVWGHRTSVSTPLYDMSDNPRPYFSSLISQWESPGYTTIQLPPWNEVTTLEYGQRRIMMMLGDMDCDGAINGKPGQTDEKAATMAPYILWSAGPDRYFGPISLREHPSNPGTMIQRMPTAAEVAKCDDVTSFRP
jgi:hypothetical protein